MWLDGLSTKLGVTPQGMGRMGGMGGTVGGMQSMPLFMVTGGFGGDASGAGAYGPHAQVGHCLWALLVAMLGGILARLLFAIPARRSETRRDDSDAASRPSWKRWSGPAAVAVSGLALLAMLGAVRARSGPGLWAGATFLVTCGLLGVTRAGCGARSRPARGDLAGGDAFRCYLHDSCLRPRSNPVPDAAPADRPFPDRAKPWLPRAAEGFFVSSENVAVANAHILKALDEPVPMHFRDEATLEDVVKHIQAAITGPDGKVIPIYLDPIGMQEAERFPQSVVSLDIDGVPLKSTLYLCLKQLDLAYCIRDGVLVITSLESQESGPIVYEDPFLIGGHCVLTLFAAVLGGALAPLVSDSRRESR